MNVVNLQLWFQPRSSFFKKRPGPESTLALGTKRHYKRQKKNYNFVFKQNFQTHTQENSVSDLGLYNKF
jgi:hypothetical protein